MKKHLTLILFIASCLCSIAQENSIFTRTGVMKGHDYVDLGLPSGTMWATCNVGARWSIECGEYYAWGETKCKRYYTHETYKFLKYDPNDAEIYEKGKFKLTKYCSHSYKGYKGFYDNKKLLDIKDDVAHRKWKGEWRIPTNEQIEEILRECFIVETSNYNGTNVPGIIIHKAKCEKDKGHRVIENDVFEKKYTLNDIHIFLPSCGYIDSDVHINFRESGYYTSSTMRFDTTVFKKTDIDIHYLNTFLGKKHRISTLNPYNRTAGIPVRPVFVK